MSNGTETGPDNGNQALELRARIAEADARKAEAEVAKMQVESGAAKWWHARVVLIAAIIFGACCFIFAQCVSAS